MLIKCKKCGTQRRQEIADKCPVCHVPKENYVQIKLQKQRKQVWRRQDLSEFIKTIPPYLKQHRRHKWIVEERMPYIIVLREKYKQSFPQIGKIFNYVDHTTVLYHYNK